MLAAVARGRADPVGVEQHAEVQVIGLALHVVGAGRHVD
jgi:hypothetical protein